MGKAMAQLKNATNDIKSEIQKGADANGLTDTFKDIHGNFTDVSQNIKPKSAKPKTTSPTK
jgi:sec-independent protein translocase protein TatA